LQRPESSETIRPILKKGLFPTNSAKLILIKFVYTYLKKKVVPIEILSFGPEKRYGVTPG
jgi:hypothetical protein